MTALINALQHELAGYKRRGLDERAKDVVAQLVLLGCEEVLLTHQTPSLVSTEENSSPQTPATIVSKARKSAAVIKTANKKRTK